MTDNILKRYWRVYGGIYALLTSPYFWVSLFFTGALYPQWSEPLWWEDVLSIMPSLLGFSLGGYAMWIAIGDDNFRKLISGEDKGGKPSPYMEVNAAFVHFIVCQMLAIFLGLLAKTYYIDLSRTNWLLVTFGSHFKIIVLLLYGFSYFVFIYALSTALAATFALLRVSSWYDMYQSDDNGQVVVSDIEKLEKLSALKNSGVLSEEEFTKKKEEILRRL